MTINYLDAPAGAMDEVKRAPVGDGAFVSPNIAIQESCREESILTQDQQAIIECVGSRPWAYSNESAGRGYFNPSKRRGKKIQESWAVRLRSLMSNIDEIRVVYGSTKQAMPSSLLRSALCWNW